MNDNGNGKSRWICGPAPQRDASVRLFCFPYAGSGAAVFLPWRAPFATSAIDLCCVQLPGRETRFTEVLISAMPELVRGICDGIEPHLDRPFSLFGHSMGAVISYEVARELARRGLPLPEWLFVSGSLPPHRRELESLHTLPDAELIETLVCRYNGIPAEILSNQEALDVALPILRSDFALMERYRHEASDAMPVKIAAFGGTTDPFVPAPELERWRDLTAESQRFHIRVFDGDHFFLHEQRAAVIDEIARLLDNDAPRSIADR